MDTLLTPASLPALPALATSQPSRTDIRKTTGVPQFSHTLHQAKIAGHPYGNGITLRGQNLPAPPAEAEVPPHIQKAAKDFEATILAQMLAPMFENTGKNGMFGDGYANEVYKSMMVQEYGKSISDAGGIGIARHVEQQLMRPHSR